jgi:hypothetical protein
MYWLKPRKTAPTAITVATPMITPSTVRNERSLCARSASSAIAMTSFRGIGGISNL